MERHRQFTIDRLSHDGRGIARDDGKICFVAGALPGETVTARSLKVAARHDDYVVVAVERPAAQRVAPPCPHFGVCGGCDLMHLDPTRQIAHKEQALLELLARQAQLTPRVVAAPLGDAPFGYRRRARLAIDSPRDGTSTVGFRREGDASVVGIGACLVLVPVLASLPRQLAAVLCDSSEPRRLGHLELSQSEYGADAVEAVVGARISGALPTADRARWARWAAEVGAHFMTENGAGEVELLHSPGAVPPGYRLPAFDLRLEFLPGDFLQANAAVNRALVARVVDWLDAGDGARVLDAFCGLGNFALPLARRGARVLGAEVSATLVRRAGHNAVINTVVGTDFIVRDMQTESIVLPGGRFDGVVLDPPRTGAAALVGWIARQKIPRVVYVSCAPGTFVRDARVLAQAGYRLERLAAVDMFPQTAHSESIALFTRPAKR